MRHRGFVRDAGPKKPHFLPTRPSEQSVGSGWADAARRMSSESLPRRASIDDVPISEFMRRDVLRGDARTPLRRVVELMHERGCGEFMVCEADFPIGIITEHDAVELLGDVLRGRGLADVSARAVMASPLHTLPESETLGDVIRMMKQQPFRRVPIVDATNKLTGIVNLLEIQSAMYDALEKHRGDLEAMVEARTAELSEANERLEALSLRDGLTSLFNRRAMGQKLETLHALAMRHRKSPYSLILCDIDHFKRLNDRLGHLEGDRVLRQVAAVLARAVRVSDSVFRYGGEEFLIALPQTDLEGGRWVAERIRTEMAREAIAHPDSSVSSQVTLSYGVSEACEDDFDGFDSWNRTIERADRALYRAKHAGRDRVVCSNDDV